MKRVSLIGAILAARCAEVSESEETFHGFASQEGVVAWSSILSVVFGFYWVLIWLPFDKNRFQFLAIPYLVLPFVGALAAYWSRRMKGSVLERIVSALFPVFAFVALFAVRIVFGLFFEGEPYTLPHFLAGFSVTLVFIVVGGLLLVLGAWPFCRPHLREQLP